MIACDLFFLDDNIDDLLNVGAVHLIVFVNIGFLNIILINNHIDNGLNVRTIHFIVNIHIALLYDLPDGCHERRTSE